MGLRGIGSFPRSARRDADTDTPALETELTERGFFTVEVIELFLALERCPDSFHGEDARRLAHLLGLTAERLKIAFVNDRSAELGYPPGHLTDIAFQKVRGIRQQLLAVCAQRADESKAAAEAPPPVEQPESAA